MASGNLPVPDLGTYSARGFTRGRPAIVEALWIVVQALAVSAWLPGSWHRRALLRAFGARIGAGVVLKPGIRVKFPWRLTIGDHSWIGEDAWIDNLAEVSIGANCCVSQGAYLCTGSHDWSAPGFDLIVRPITLEAGAWIAARAIVGPGVTAGRGSVLGMASAATRDLDPWTVYAGVPAVAVRQRIITGSSE
jgi:putative colanic acid biosynthesis acetyltransferase WcaF